MYRYSLYFLCILTLLGCQSAKPGKNSVGNLLNKGSAAFGILSTYEGIKRDFENGRIMQARERAKAMDKSNKDYAKVQRLLQRKIEPARQRLFSYYLSVAKKAENSGQWHKALQAYEQAAEVSLDPDDIEQKRLQAEFNLRQLRLDVLLKQRRLEDDFLLQHLHAYEPPQGISPSDDIFLRRREEREDDLDRRASLAYRDAWRYLRKGMPEVAYVEIESYLRLQPDSERGKKLMAEIRQAVPKELSIPAAETGKSEPAADKREPVKKAAKKRMMVPATVTADQVREHMKREEWLQARQYALAYRREGGADADMLLARIQASIEKEAAADFAKGGEFFRQEHLDKAIAYWERAVALMPDEAEYVEALRRARQLKERLNLLRHGGSSASDSEQ